MIDIPSHIIEAIVPSLCPIGRTTIQEQLEKTIHYLSSTMSVRDEEVYSTLRRITGFNTSNATTEILQVAVYLLSNKIAPDPYLVCYGLLKWFQMGSNYRLLKAILSYELPTIEAFVEGIFRSAVEKEDIQIIRIFLESGMNPDIKIRHGTGSTTAGRQTALQIATRKGNFGLVSLLLEFRANVEGPSLNFYNLLPLTPLQIAAQNGNMEIAQFLISRGAAVNYPPKGYSLFNLPHEKDIPN